MMPAVARKLHPPPREMPVFLNPQRFLLMKYSSPDITHQLSHTKLLISITKTFLMFRMLLALKRMLRWCRD